MSNFGATNLETADIGAATRKTIFLIGAALFAICALNLWLSFALASLAHGAELGAALDAPRQLQPRFDTDSNSAPSRGRRTHSPQLTSTMTVGQCGHLTIPRERQDCMVRASGGPWSYVPAATINDAAVAVIVSGDSK
ncbi:MAG: hypothetical protein K0Q70_2286 [Rhodospirillales bacterium]|nr:hypothetical protein [Rhodospirillales bacterium]